MSKSLFDLIKTLSKAEKRVFSENLKETKRKLLYVKLVAVYSNTEVYSPKIDLKIFKSENTKFISECKSKCRNLIYDYLVTLEKNRGIKKQVQHKIKIVLMLINRRQFYPAQNLLHKLDIMASKYELFDLQIKIKTQKIFLEILFAGETGNVDLNHLQLLTQEKRTIIQRFSDIQNAKSESHFEMLSWQVNMGEFSCEPIERKHSDDEFKNISMSLIEHQKKFFKYQNDKKFEQALYELKQVIALVTKNNEVVLESECLTLSYSAYLSLYVELCITLGKKVDIEQIIEQFERIPYNSLKEQWAILYTKKITGCNYALSINNPRIAMPWIEEFELFCKSHNYVIS